MEKWRGKADRDNEEGIGMWMENEGRMEREDKDDWMLGKDGKMEREGRQG